MKRLLAVAFAATILAGCGSHRDATIGIVDIARVTAHWPKFINYENQLSADTQAIAVNGASNVRAQAMSDLQSRYAKLQQEITDDVRDAAHDVATRRRLNLVVTREFVGYGGVDITSDVESELKIVETPAPSSSGPTP